VGNSHLIPLLSLPSSRKLFLLPQLLKAKNTEIETAVEDVIASLQSHPLDPTIPPVAEAELDKLRLTYNSMMYQALITCARSSLTAIKSRLCRRGGMGFLFIEQPFFEVDVQLSVPTVRLAPTLEDVQKSVVRCAAMVLNAFKFVWEWGQLGEPDPPGGPVQTTFILPSPVARTPQRNSSFRGSLPGSGGGTGTPGVVRGLFRSNSITGRQSPLVVSPHQADHTGKVSFFERVGKDVEIVKTCLLLTGAFYGVKTHVATYLSGFRKYDWLWKEDMELAYKRFAAQHPTIEVSP
jgi:hypothetical protein